MTTSVTIINHGPLPVKVQPYDDNTGKRFEVPAIVLEASRILGPQTIYSGRAYTIEEVNGLKEQSRPFVYGTVNGEQRTIHGTEHLDVETDHDGNVVAVWFRCSMLPFEQVAVGASRAADMRRVEINKELRLLNVTLHKKS